MKKLIFLLLLFASVVHSQNGGYGPTLNSGSSSTVSSPAANSLDPTQPPYNVKADVFKTGNDGTTTNTQNSFSSTNQSCSGADVGKLIIVINPSTGAYPFGVGLQTVSACNGANWTVSTTANANLAGNAVWAIGSAGNGAGFLAAYKAAIAANQTLAIPCGAMIIDTPPFFIPATTKFSYVTNSFNLQGCNSAQGSRFILHPNFGLGNPNPLSFAYFNNANPATGSFTFPGDSTDAKAENLFITSMGGAIPCAAGQQINFFQNYNVVSHIHINAIGFSASTCTFTGLTMGEANAGFLDFQFNSTSLAGQPTEIGVLMAGQGQNTAHDSIFAFAPMIAMECSANTNCVFSNNYVTQATTGVQATGAGGKFTITGNQMTVNTQCITDGGFAATFYIFGNSSCGGNSANQASISLTSSSSIADISGTNINNTTSGYGITGTGTVNDRAGNSYNGPLTQFTGTYVPIGGGSSATNGTSATTNFGTAITTQNIVAVTLAPSTYDIKVGARQITLGVGCGAGSNTVTPTLNWVSGGLAQSATLNVLTISANGTVGTSSVYNSTAIHVDGNTAITYTAASVLASAGCSTTPQYVVDFSNI